MSVTSLSVASVLIVAGTIWSIGIAGRAERLAQDLRDAGTSAESAIVAADSEMIDRLITEMSDSRHSVTEFDGDLWPLKALGSVFGWVPFLGDNLTAAPEITDRLKHDIDAVIELLDAADDLMASYRLVSSGDQGLVTLLRALPQEADLREVLLTLEVADISLREAEKTATGMNYGRLWAG